MARSTSFTILSMENLVKHIFRGMAPRVDAPNPAAVLIMPHFRILYNETIGQPLWYDEWFDEDNARHREDGPAIIGEDGTEAWWFHGLLHRIGGPAITAGQYQAWWEYGVCLKILFENGRVYEGTVELPVRYAGSDPAAIEATSDLNFVVPQSSDLAAEAGLVKG